MEKVIKSFIHRLYASITNMETSPIYAGWGVLPLRFYDLHGVELSSRPLSTGWGVLHEITLTQKMVFRVLVPYLRGGVFYRKKQPKLYRR